MKRPTLVLGLAVAAACTPVEAVPLSNAPVNTCPCEAYQGSGAECIVSTNRCEVQTAPNRVGFPIFLTISVPDSAFYAPSTTFILFTDANGGPTFTRTSTTTSATQTRCSSARCVELSGLAAVTSEYRVARDQSVRVGYPLGDHQPIPVRVEYESLADASFAPLFSPGLPLGPRFVNPVKSQQTLGPVTGAAIPYGRYRRVMYPLPPFDELFPPRGSREPASGLDKFDVKDPAISDQFELTAAALDPTATRSVSVRRDEGLDGWQVWVQDSSTKLRISTLKTLKESGSTGTTLTMDTTGETRSLSNGGLGDTVEVVVSPPASYIAQPVYINPVIGGDLGTIRYPYVFPPVKVAGVVAEPDKGLGLLGYAAHVTFESVTIATPREPSTSSPLLHYATDLETDDRGQFATVLTPGTYDVTIEPAIGTNFAKSRQVVVVDKDVNTLTLRPPPRTRVTGRVVLTDGRPVIEADVIATPQTPPATISATPRARANQTKTGGDGGFAFDLDQGPYVITAIPKPGTGFPQLATRTEILASETPPLELRVPPPNVLKFTVRDPTRSENTVAAALVRVFAVPTDPTQEALEIGNATTDANGSVEILLAPGAK